MENYEERIARLAALLKKSRNGILMTGAGFSTESGLSDFRSPGVAEAATGRYGMPPELILTADCLERKPELFFRYYREVFLKKASPNAGHYAAAALEKQGHLFSVITQNTDGLHEAAGSVHVLALHGTVNENRCTECGKYLPRSAMEGNAPVPLCPVCGGRLKPGIVLYDEPLDEYVLRAARARMFATDLLIIAGTSLSVQPAASLPEYYMGKELVIINRTETPLDGSATLRFHENCGRVLEDALSGMQTRPAPEQP